MMLRHLNLDPVTIRVKGFKHRCIGESFQDFEADVSFKIFNLAAYNSFSGLFSGYLKATIPPLPT